MLTHRVAVVGSLDVVPWVPLYGGLLEAVRQRGAVARAFHCGAFDDVGRAEFAAWSPDAVIFPVCQRFAEKTREWIALARTVRAKCILATFDDPYDCLTTLQLAPLVDAIVTPEANVLDAYRAIVPIVRLLVPPIDGRMHFPAAAAPAQMIGVAHLGGTKWLPRRTIVPALRDACRRAGVIYSEVAGITRWLVGEALSRWLHTVRVLVDVPRWEYATVSNPLQQSCSYTGPRVHIASACSVMALMVDPRLDIEDLYPSLPCCTAEQTIEAALYWSADARNAERLERAAAARERWLALWQPSRAPAQVLGELLGVLLASEQGSRCGEGPPPTHGSSARRDGRPAAGPVSQLAEASPPAVAPPR